MSYLSNNQYDSVDRIGGKAAGLNLLLAMTGDTFKIPRFTVLTADAFYECLKLSGIDFQQIVNYDANQLKRVEKALMSVKIPPRMFVEVEEWIKEISGIL